ncbi:hypothetical protein K7X08_037866 [Anisodus acutangulus]|uniref:Uncharacterized protein n=1 Tax=Anisodus acutangulus TaxID=402998 RepID=A0A9Q1MXA4_9SOLA|nr:hypothetical protein K7X08_037866 [Anisodus acutangulus]
MERRHSPQEDNSKLATQAVKPKQVATENRAKQAPQSARRQARPQQTWQKNGKMVTQQQSVEGRNTNNDKPGEDSAQESEWAQIIDQAVARSPNKYPRGNAAVTVQNAFNPLVTQMPNVVGTSCGVTRKEKERGHKEQVIGEILVR